MKSMDVCRVFTNSKVQQLLIKLARCDAGRVLTSEFVEKKDQLSYLQLLSDKELEEFNEVTHQRAESQLVPPPYLPPWQDEERVLSNDPELAGYDNAKLVCTDVTYGVKDRERIVTVREPCGKLRLANNEEHARINRIYFPGEHRFVEHYTLFTDERFLERALHKSQHEHILDLACWQFEPDDPLYIQVRNAVFDHADTNGLYSLLLSTRHFGSLAFHLAAERRIDNLLFHYLSELRQQDAERIVQLFYLVHTDLAPSLYIAGIELVKHYAETDSTKQSKLMNLIANLSPHQEAAGLS